MTGSGREAPARGRAAGATPGDERPASRRSAATRRALLDAALRVAESDGWDAVTTRRVAAVIDYRQPVVYQHFASRAALIEAVVLEGFDALTERIEAVSTGPSSDRLEGVAHAYLRFAQERPRRYEAMFSRPSGLEFASTATPPALRGAFDALSGVVAEAAPGGESAATAELFWACCHGLATLALAQRIPTARIEGHVRRIVGLVRR